MLVKIYSKVPPPRKGAESTVERAPYGIPPAHMVRVVDYGQAPFIKNWLTQNKENIITRKTLLQK